MVTQESLTIVNITADCLVGGWCCCARVAQVLHARLVQLAQRLHLVVVLVLVARVFVVVLRLGRLAGALHRRQDLGFLALGHSAEPDCVARHADGDALFQPTVLAPVPVDAHYGALLVFAARPVLDLLLDGAAEESLAALARVHPVVEPARLVAAHLAQDGAAVELDAGRLLFGAVLRLLERGLLDLVGHVGLVWCLG